MRCISLWTFSLRVKPQLPQKSIWLPDSGHRSGKAARAQLHNGCSCKPGSNFFKVLPRKSYVIETVPLFPPFHTVPVYYFVFHVQAHPETVTDLYSLPFLSFSGLFPWFLLLSLVSTFSPLSHTSLSSASSLSHTRSSADHLQQPGVHKNWWQWREGAPLPGPNLRPVLQWSAGA